MGGLRQKTSATIQSSDPMNPCRSQSSNMKCILCDSTSKCLTHPGDVEVMVSGLEARGWLG